MRGARTRVRGSESEPPRARSLPEQIAEWLSEEILREELAPGERITEMAVAERFGVSRGPVRDAFKLLELQGLVSIQPRRGARVTELNAQEVDEIFLIRAVLGGLAARMMMEKAPEAVISDFIHRARKIRELVPNREKFYQESSALSDVMTAYGGEGRLAELMRSLQKSVQRVRYHTFGDRKAREETAELFREVAGAFETGDPEKVRWVVERMGEELRRRIVAAVNEDAERKTG
jgi:DNA-binding GntR family transcriptional regulator